MKPMMASGGALVAAGTYWSFSEGDVVRLERDGALPGSPASRFLRLPLALLLLLSPVLGLLFVMFLPVAGIVLTITLPVKALVQRLRAGGTLSSAGPRIDRQES